MNKKYLEYVKQFLYVILFKTIISIDFKIKNFLNVFLFLIPSSKKNIFK